MTTEKHANVMGYLSRNWPGLNDAVPALIINPEATPVDLLAWCWGEVASMQAALNTLVSLGEPIVAGELSALFLHRIAPIEVVLSEAIDALANAGQKAGG